MIAFPTMVKVCLTRPMAALLVFGFEEVYAGSKLRSSTVREEPGTPACRKPLGRVRGGLVRDQGLRRLWRASQLCLGLKTAKVLADRLGQQPGHHGGLLGSFLVLVPTPVALQHLRWAAPYIRNLHSWRVGIRLWLWLFSWPKRRSRSSGRTARRCSRTDFLGFAGGIQPPAPCPSAVPMASLFSYMERARHSLWTVPDKGRPRMHKRMTVLAAASMMPIVRSLDLLLAFDESAFSLFFSVLLMSLCT